MRGLLLSLLLFLSSVSPARPGEPLIVFAAASLRTALDAVAADWQAQTGIAVAVSYAGSSALVRQIEAGAPADIFLSAAVDWMDVLEREGLLREGTRVDLLGNALVLVAHGTDAPKIAIAPGFDLSGILGDGRLAMALVDAVPAGQYGKAALTTLGIWDAVAPRVAQADDPRAALALVARGEAPLGVVYASDVIAGRAAGWTVSVAGTFPEGIHPPIIYPGAVIAASTHPQAEAFLSNLGVPASAAVFRAHGFTILAPGG